MVIGTAGHIDHGKTTLVKALTGRDTDRLPEERRRGISIDLGYAEISLPGGATASLVDVPGHERFVRHMVAGATGIDAFLLVVACDDGVMPQTREHLRILDVLGVERGVCALTRRDLVDDETAELAGLDAEELLEGRNVPIVETSARTGLGLDELRERLGSLAGAAEPAPRDAPVRLWVDRVFALRGAGTIATGTLWSGTIEPHQTLAALPSGDSVRVRSVQVHNHDVKVAEPGRRVAVALTGTSPRELRRGTLLCTPGAFGTSYRLDVRLLGVELPDGVAPVTMHQGTGEYPSRLVTRGELGQLRLAHPVSAARGDRIVLRWNGETIGGGVVVDPSPPRRVDAERIRRYASGSPREIVEALLDAAPAPLSEDELLHCGVLTRGQVEEGLAQAVDLGGRYVTVARHEQMLRDLLARLDRRAAETPLNPGVPVEEVGPPGRWRDRFLEGLPVERRGSQVFRAGAAPDTGGYEDVIERLRGRLAEAGATPVALRDASGLPEAEFYPLARELERAGEVVFVRHDLGMSPAAYAEVRDRLVAACESDGAVSLGAFRDVLGTSRKTAELLLRHFDGAGLTRRVGDDRVLRKHSRRSTNSDPTCKFRIQNLEV